MEPACRKQQSICAPLAVSNHNDQVRSLELGRMGTNIMLKVHVTALLHSTIALERDFFYLGIAEAKLCARMSECMRVWLNQLHQSDRQ